MSQEPNDPLALNECCRLMQETDRRKDAFLATVAHELRGPLAPIRNAVHLLGLTCPPTEEVEWAKSIIERQLRQMTRLIDDLLDVSRISLGKLELDKKQVLLSTVLKQAVETSRPWIDKYQHILTVSLHATPLPLKADPTRLVQIFSNLLNNAAKFSHSGGHIWLKSQREGDEAVITIKDTGVGIATDALPHLFSLYVQVETSLEYADGGLGIGLALVKKLVELHGGSVQAHSDGLGQGSEFVVRLPIDITSERLPDESEFRPASQTVSGLRLLVVDDNRDAADTLAIMLQVLGNELHTVYDGDAAIKAAADFQPDVMLLDIGLPKLNGYEVARKIREESWGKEIFLIAVTGWGQDIDRERSKAVGFDDHMVKPVETTSLIKVLAGLRKAEGRTSRDTPVALLHCSAAGGNHCCGL